MIRFFGPLIMVRARYDAMTPAEQYSALRNLGVDLALLVFFGAMVLVGLTSNFNAFYFWVPLLCFFVWIRFKQARERWDL